MTAQEYEEVVRYAQEKVRRTSFAPDLSTDYEDAHGTGHEEYGPDVRDAMRRHPSGK